MRFTLFTPRVVDIPDGLLVGLAERANKRLGRPLERDVWSEDLFEQAVLDKVIDQPPADSMLDSDDCLRLSRRELAARDRSSTIGRR